MPGISPVVSVARLVAVVEGNDVCTVAWAISEARVGATDEYFSNASAPKPSMRKRSSRPDGDCPALIESAALASPNEEKIDGMICDKCTEVSSHEC